VGWEYSNVFFRSDFHVPHSRGSRSGVLDVASSTPFGRWERVFFMRPVTPPARNLARSGEGASRCLSDDVLAAQPQDRMNISSTTAQDISLRSWRWFPDQTLLWIGVAALEGKKHGTHARNVFLVLLAQTFRKSEDLPGPRTRPTGRRLGYDRWT